MTDQSKQAAEKVLPAYHPFYSSRRHTDTARARRAVSDIGIV